MPILKTSTVGICVLAAWCSVAVAETGKTLAEGKPAYPVHVGDFPCAEQVKVSVHPDPHQPHRYMLHLGKNQYHMHAVDTSTGVVRLEDPKQGLVWLQLGNKSMLMNSKLGRRMADGCMSREQVLVAQAMQNKPAQDLFAAPSGAR
jgi:hypothetical protein